MADICPVCNQKIGFFDSANEFPQGMIVHSQCLSEFNQNPEKYGGISLKQSVKEDSKTEINEMAANDSSTSQSHSTQKVEVTNIDMPFENMVGFMVKWALASIPAFIILAIIGGIFFAIFGSIFRSIFF